MHLEAASGGSWKSPGSEIARDRTMARPERFERSTPGFVVMKVSI
jgi:hypothetical protein